MDYFSYLKYQWKKKLILICIILVVLSVGGKAFAEDLKFQIESSKNLRMNLDKFMLRGSISCGKWDKSRKQNNSQEYEWWVLGFVSGINYMNEHFIDVARGKDQLSIFLWIDKYCKENPLQSSVSAIDRFVFEFSERYYCKHLANSTSQEIDALKDFDFKCD